MSSTIGLLFIVILQANYVFQNPITVINPMTSTSWFENKTKFAIFVVVVVLSGMIAVLLLICLFLCCNLEKQKDQKKDKERDRSKSSKKKDKRSPETSQKLKNQPKKEKIELFYEKPVVKVQSLRSSDIEEREKSNETSDKKSGFFYPHQSADNTSDTSLIRPTTIFKEKGSIKISPEKDAIFEYIIQHKPENTTFIMHSFKDRKYREFYWDVLNNKKTKRFTDYKEDLNEFHMNAANASGSRDLKYYENVEPQNASVRKLGKNWRRIQVLESVYIGPQDQRYAWDLKGNFLTPDHNKTDKPKESEKKKYMRKQLAFLKKTISAKEIKDEVMLERSGFSITRKELGSGGSHSTTFKAKQDQNEDIVCKVIIFDKCKPKLRANLTAKSLKIMRFLGSDGEGGGARHQAFVHVLDMFCTNQKVYIFMSECQNISLSKRIRAGEVGEQELKQWAKQLAEAIGYLHSSGISHNTVRAEHVIFDKENLIKLIGLGMASIYWDSDTEQVITKKKINTDKKDKKELEELNHLPPEAFQSDAYDPSLADIWGFGVVLCQLITKENPFKVKAKETHEELWRAFAESNQFSEEAKQLLDRIFVGDSSSRVRIDDIITDPFMKNGFSF